MKTIGQIFSKLRNEGFFDDKHYLGADSILSGDDISEQLLPSPQKKELYLFNTKNFNDIILGEKFTVVFDIKNPRNYHKTDCVIDYVSLKKKDNIHLLPEGYSGVVRLNFKDEIPEFAQQGDDNKNNSRLLFTSQEVMDKILQELEKAEGQVS